MTSQQCQWCIPEIDYKCEEHKPFGCSSCGLTDETKLFYTAMGVFCKKCKAKWAIF